MQDRLRERRLNAYLTEAVAPDLACQGALQRVQLIVDSIEYTR
jgi:hypothetical protein